MKIYKPQTVKETIDALGTKDTIVIYKTIDDTPFVLNPFGGWHTTTHEVNLVDGWTITENKLPRIVIVEIE